MARFGVTPGKAAELRQRMARVGVDEADLEETFVRSGGPGGQKVNRSATCVCLRHAPTGIEVKMQRSRSQGLNRFYARRRLCELVEERLLGEESPANQERQKIRKQKQRRRRRNRAKEAE